jgi:HAD superfamily hydrolase (TIGR01509 family)
MMASGYRATAPELVIFDCDGVLVDSDRISLQIQAEHITALGLPMDSDDCAREFLGIGMESTVGMIEATLGRPVPTGWLSELEAEVNKAFRRELQVVPGILSALEQITLPTCVASGGSHEKMRLTLGLTGLWERFEGRIFSATEVPRPKPEPDLFRHAAREMGADPARCIVVEDSPFGVAGAKAACMHVLGFAALTPPQRLDGADAVFTAMEDLPGLISNVARRSLVNEPSGALAMTH